MATLETQYKNYQRQFPQSNLTFDEWKKQLVNNLKTEFEKLMLIPEKMEEIRLEPIKRNKEQSLESQLGYFVGEYIVHRYLPTLSTDVMLSRKVIQVSEEDTAENKRLSDEWSETARNSKDGRNEKWVTYFNHNKMLKKKYLPEKLICHVRRLNIENMDEFKDGLITSLWDCDMCSYSLKPENINIYDEHHGYFTVIEFIRGVDE